MHSSIGAVAIVRRTSGAAPIFYGNTALDKQSTVQASFQHREWVSHPFKA